MRCSIALAAALLTPACQAEQTTKEADVVANHAAPEPDVQPANEIADNPPPSAPAPAPSGEPGPTPRSETSPAAAVAALQAYCDAIAHKDYASAYHLWSGDGEASGMTKAAFAASFAKYDAFDCSFATPGDAEGAAGSSFITVPTVVTGTLARGSGFVLRGPMTLRRVNDVPGSSTEQRHWHIFASGLKPRP